MKHDDRPRNADDQRGLPQIEQRFRRFTLVGQHFREHEHDGHFRDLGRLTDAVAPDRQPALRARGGSGSLPDHESESEQEDRQRVQRRRHPFDESNRGMSDGVGEAHSDQKPEDLRLV